MNIFEEAARLEKQNCPFALAQIVDSRGSTPRHSAWMLIREDGATVGTIGGGMVERKVITEALEALREKASRMFHGRMVRSGSAAVGADCGGAMSVYISVHGLRPKLWLLGAGHVNRAVAQGAALLDFDISVGDIYQESLNPDYFPASTHLIHASSFAGVVSHMAICPEDYVLIATNNQDREVLEHLISRPVAWLGLLASRRKVRFFLHQLQENGVPQVDVNRLRAPAGYDIGAETPHEIAISILAEVLQVKNRAAGGLMTQVSNTSPRAEEPLRDAESTDTGIILPEC
ncbi:XdhC family protein [Salmonella enterica]|nr:XdhC family protein [Salmonella enterica]HED0310756.1 XdhC family protein [Salmonella enterica subsp. enterica serovar Newport]